MYKVFFTKKADKQISKIAKTDAKRILEKVSKLNYPFPTNFDITKIASKKDYFRLRVGDTRTILKIVDDKKQIIVRKIDYRGGVYKGNF